VPPADAVELAKHAALQQGPEAFDGVGVNVSVHVPVLVLDDGVRQNLGHAEIALVFVGDQAGPGRIDALPHEGPHVPALHLLFGRRFSRYLATALDRADHGSLVGAPATFVRPVIVPSITLARLAAYIGFVHFHDARQKAALFGLRHRLADLHGDTLGGVLVHVQITGELKCG